MEEQLQAHHYNFIAGSGEMGELIRSKDWSVTSIGKIDGWPQALKITLGIMLNSAFPMFLWWGPELTCFYNDAYRPSLGNKGKHPAILGMPAPQAWPEIWETIEPFITQVMDGKASIWREDQLIPIYRNDQIEDVYWTFSYSPVKDEAGAIAAVLVTCVETTEKVNVYKKLQENKEQLQFAIDSAELGTWELHLQTEVLHHSEKFAEMLGYKKGTNLSLRQILLHIHPDDVFSREAALAKAYETSVLHHISRFILSDDSVQWVENKGKVFYDENHMPLKLIGTTRDITAEKSYQQQLEAREQKFRALADSMPQFVWTADAVGNLNYFNQSVYNYSGLSPEKLSSEGWLQIVHPEEREENVSKWLHSITTGELFIFEHRFRRLDGEYRWQLSRAIPQKDETGKIYMWVGTSTDVEKQKAFTRELEKQVQLRTKQLEEKNKELQGMNAELQSFAYVSSHDLQEPLRKIQVFANLIREKEKDGLSANALDYFQRMQAASARMQTLIDDLLTYSRTNITERNFEKTSLNKILEEVKTDLKEDIQQKNAVVEASNLCEVPIITFQFRQLLNNLIGNSLKFSKPGVAPHIKVESRTQFGATLDHPRLLPQQTYCHVSVTDNGIGFEPEYKDRIFEVFQRLHGKATYKGTGIGLAIVKKIVDNHRGVVSATGKVDQGAVFDIYFPVE